MNAALTRRFKARAYAARAAGSQSRRPRIAASYAGDSALKVEPLRAVVRPESRQF